MTDIVERLRQLGSEESLRWSLLDLASEAADEIERLRKALSASEARNNVFETGQRLETENERLRATLQEIEFHGGPAGAMARRALS